MVLVGIFLWSSLSTCLVNAYGVGEIIIASDTDEYYNPIGHSESFFTSQGSVYCWINVTDVEESREVEFEWYNPQDEVYMSDTFTIPEPSEGYYWSGYPVLSFIGVYGHPPSQNTGMWKVKIYIDQDLGGTRSFEIVSYDQYLMDMENYEDTLNQYYSILADYRELIDKYEISSHDFNELTDDYNELMGEYKSKVVELNNLKMEYDDLEAQYEDAISGVPAFPILSVIIGSSIALVLIMKKRYI